MTDAELQTAAQRYQAEHVSVLELASELGVSEWTLRRRFHAAGVHIRNPNEKQFSDDQLQAAATRYMDTPTMTLDEAARSIGANRETLRRWMAPRGMTRRSKGAHQKRLKLTREDASAGHCRLCGILLDQSGDDWHEDDDPQRKDRTCWYCKATRVKAKPRSR